MKKTDKVYLEEIIEVTKRICTRLERINYNKTVFSDEYNRDAFIPPLIQIGESVKNLASLNPNLAEEITNHRTSSVISMRNMIAHEYLNANTKVIWSTITKDIPNLGIATAKVLNKKFNTVYSEEYNLYKSTKNKIKLLEKNDKSNGFSR